MSSSTSHQGFPSPAGSLDDVVESPGKRGGKGSRSSTPGQICAHSRSPLSRCEPSSAHSSPRHKSRPTTPTSREPLPSPLLNSTDVLPPISLPPAYTQAPVTVCALTDQAHFAVVLHDNHSLCVWDVRTNLPRCETLRGHSLTVSSVALSQDATLLVTGSHDKTVRIWFVTTQNQRCTVIRGHNSAVTAVALSRDKKIIASGSGDASIRMWDSQTGKEFGEPLLGHKAAVKTLAISADGKLMVSGSYDNTVRVWDIFSSKLVGHALRGHVNSVEVVAISSDNETVVSGSSDETLRVWNISDWKHSNSATVRHSHVWTLDSSVSAIYLSPAGGFIYAGCRSGSLAAICCHRAKIVNETICDKGVPVLAIGLSADSRYVFAASAALLLHWWCPVENMALNYTLGAHEDCVTDLAIDGADEHLVTCASNGTVRYWDLSTIISGHVKSTALHVHASNATSVSVTSDGSRVVSTSYDMTVAVCNVDGRNTGAMKLRGHDDWVTAVALTPDEKRIVSGSADCTIRVWNFKDGEPAGQPLSGHEDWVTCIAVTACGDAAVSGSYDCTLRIWDMKNMKPSGPALLGHEDWVTSIALHVDGNLIVSGSLDRTIRFWNLRSRSEAFAPIFNDAPVGSVAITSDGRQILSGDYSGVIRVWDANRRDLVGVLSNRHNKLVTELRVTTDNNWVLSSSFDGTIRIRSMAQGKFRVGEFDAVENKLKSRTSSSSPWTSSLFFPAYRHQSEVELSSRQYAIVSKYKRISRRSSIIRKRVHCSRKEASTHLDLLVRWLCTLNTLLEIEKLRFFITRRWHVLFQSIQCRVDQVSQQHLEYKAKELTAMGGKSVSSPGGHGNGRTSLNAEENDDPPDGNDSSDSNDDRNGYGPCHSMDRTVDEIEKRKRRKEREAIKWVVRLSAAENIHCWLDSLSTVVLNVTTGSIAPRTCEDLKRTTWRFASVALNAWFERNDPEDISFDITRQSSLVGNILLHGFLVFHLFFMDMGSKRIACLDKTWLISQFQIPNQDCTEAISGRLLQCFASNCVRTCNQYIDWMAQGWDSSSDERKILETARAILETQHVKSDLLADSPGAFKFENLKSVVSKCLNILEPVCEGDHPTTSWPAPLHDLSQSTPAGPSPHQGPSHSVAFADSYFRLHHGGGLSRISRRKIIRRAWAHHPLARLMNSYQSVG